MRAHFTLYAALTVLISGCAHTNRQASVPKPPANSYFDVAPGTRLRVVTPITKSGAFQPAYTGHTQAGATITLLAHDLVGFRTAHYIAEGRGRVQLRLQYAELSREGKSTVEATPPDPPFPLPSHAAHLRLIYLIRASTADHNMALVAAKHVQALDTFTLALQSDPNVCGRRPAVFCTWIPGGVAVRPE
jgi:hypothetical protein